MPHSSQLLHLITLLEDESVRPDVVNELTTFGASLEVKITEQDIALNAEQARLIRPLLNQHYRGWIGEQWASWIAVREDKAQLESGLTLLAQFQLGRLYPTKVKNALDDLADEYDARYRQRDALELSEFLFQGYGLQGAEQEDYYNPLNSNLVHVIEQRRGIPISLACVYILVGDRLGLKIEGCNFPGHFLAVATTKREKVIVDCFNGGKSIDAEMLTASGASISHKDVLQLQCNSLVIIARVLRNLTNAYEQANDKEDAATLTELLIQTELNL